MKIQLTEAQMTRFGQYLGQVCQNGSVIYLNGTLGMGKTTLCRAVIQGLGWAGRVKSPTYNLLEQYELPALLAIHFDLYRLGEPQELEFIGIRDYDASANLWLIEWPEKGLGCLPVADLDLTLNEVPGLPEERLVELQALTNKGIDQLLALQPLMEIQV
ncbi:tRNA (adenosine(37)-N6)-threonylcarbamoyltransferase complex ATPase subunit type 1 TsaE [Reinekea sp.]|uniref:tRNA (adenosine(37)-N6)-threonylcarbamoyltransferase complex ATPase subunit type 1 TsaE n=1 Tax=Reinekea sp. TaxID=1970455 RepID=UPI002A83DD87|nr:tRNA (adenosine(37)-N6)-threonylcarbamoyltransferase complex ATPase subunit type 1 TsaE [Reinekea sp.]